MLGVYVHLPFCPYLCPYCDFAKWPHRASAAARYLTALQGELAATPPAPAATLFIGGGTPNAYDATALTGLIARLLEHFPSPVAQPREVSVELNPELVMPGDFERYRLAGVTRISIGVQSFEPDEVAVLGRRHSAAQVRAAVQAARAAGIGSISLDVIFAIPGQTRASWRRTLDAALALDVDHISTYGLTIEPQTPFAEWAAREPGAFASDAHEADLYGDAMAVLRAAGYEQYELSNFARPGHRCRHNENYWANGDYVGLGVGAASYRDGARWVTTRSLEAYLAAVEAGAAIPRETERLLGARRAGEAAMLALRTAQGASVVEFKERYGVDLLDRYAGEIADLRATGLLELTGEHLRLTERGRFLANDVCGAFLTFD